MSITAHLIYGAVIPPELETQFMIDAGFIDPYDAKYNFDPEMYYKRCPDCQNKLDNPDRDNDTSPRPSTLCMRCVMLDENNHCNDDSVIAKRISMVNV
jgi:hypothetical protein